MNYESVEHIVHIQEATKEFMWNAMPHVMAVMLDENDVIVQVNQLFTEQTGYSEVELVGKSAEEVLVTWVEGESSSIVRQGEKLPVIQIKTAGGSSFKASIMRLVLENERKQRHRLALLHNLVALDSGNLLRQFALTFLRDENSGVILLEPDFRISDVSPLACIVLGVKREEVIGRSMEEAFYNSPYELMLLRQMVIEEHAIHNHPLRWSREEHKFELLMDANLLWNENGKLLGAYVVFKDVTSLRSLEEQVQRSDRLAMIGQIAAGTAHEIRNPLTAIKGFLQMFRNTMKEKGMNKEYGYTEIMLNEINRINDLVSEFLLLSKPKNVQYHLVELGAVLREIMPIVNNEALLHGISIQYNPDAMLPQVISDKELLKQVFLNICKNGIEAMGNGGVLTVDGRMEKDIGVGRWIHINIRDTGKGIPPELQEKIFDPFVTTKENGTGLGLSVCQRIIHDMGGAILVSSHEAGTTFTVCIPCSVDEKHG